MKKIILIVAVFTFSLAILASPLIDNIRFSAPTIDDHIIVRGELSFFYDLSFYYADNGIWQYENFEFIEDSINSYQTELPAPNDSPLKVGLRAYNDVVSELDAGVAIQPIPLAAEEEVQINNLNWLVNDTSEDASVEESFLDIISTHFTYNDEKLFFAIENNGGGFPVSEAIWGPFYSYISLIIPNDINLTPFGLLYTVNQAGIIQPGLYKITGTDMTDIELIGEIETNIDSDNNLLTLSCDWSDLYADDDFNSWFDPEQAMFSTVAGTGMITLAGGMQETDYTYPAVVFLDQLVLENTENILPQISSIQENELTGLLSFSYLDENHNFPLTCYAVINGIDTLTFHPLSHDFTDQVNFESDQVSDLIINGWEEITVTVSDNNLDFVTSTIEQVENYDTQIITPTTQITNFPNPFNPETTISFNIVNPARVKLDIFNIKGQKVTSLGEDFYSKGNHQVLWNAKDDSGKSLPSGIYYLKIISNQEDLIHKMVLLK